MTTHRQARGRMIYVLPAIALLTLMFLYFLAYCATGSRTAGTTEIQTYQHEWQGRLFTPAVKIESAIRQKPITVDWLLENPFP